MIALLLATLLQVPDDLAGFLDALEKDRVAGAAPTDLVKRIDEWSKKRSPETLSRLAWNRELLLATEWANGLRRAWLGKKVGARVTFGKVGGIVSEVKSDRFLLQGDGGPTVVLFATLAPEDGLAEMKADKMWDEATPDEAILHFAAGKAELGLTQARAIESALSKGRALRAFVGWALQAADRHLAEGKPVRAAEFLAAGWTKHDDLMEAGDGALHRFVRDVLLDRLYPVAEQAADKDRKEARRILDLIPALSNSGEVRAKVHAMRFLAIDSNQWHPLLLEEAKFTGNGEFKDGALGWNDPTAGPTISMLRLRDLPIAWDKVSGVRAKMRHASAYFDMRVGFGDPAKFYIVAVHPKDNKIVTAYLDKEGGTPETDGGKKVATKPEYLLRLESGKPYWKLYVDNIEARMFKDPAADPSAIEFAVNEGKCEILNLEVRRK